MVRNCKNCKKYYQTKPSVRKHYCSMKCYSISKKGQTPWNKGLKGIYTEETLQKMKNIQKGKGFSAFPGNIYKGTPWNKDKKVPQISGKNHYLWKGTTPLNKWIRNRTEYQAWRALIFKRDDYTCLMCNQKGGDLVVDHWPKSLAQLIYENNITTIEEALTCDVLWDTRNNRTLCHNCHLLTDNFGRRNSLVGGGKPKWQKQPLT